MIGLDRYFNKKFAVISRLLSLVYGAWRGVCGVRCVVVLVCLALMAVGCSSAERVNIDSEPSKNPVPTLEGGASGGSGQMGVGDWPRPPFAGMRFIHPEDMFTDDEKWIYATVSIEPPCVYLTNVTDIMPDISRVSWEGRRLALSLLYPDIRFDESTHTLRNPRWGKYDIPISHGDRVIVGSRSYDETVGGKEPGDLHLFWDACAAHAFAQPVGLWTSLEWLCVNRPSGWVWHLGNELVRMCNEDTPWNQRELLEEQGIVVDVESFDLDREPGELPPEVELAWPPFYDMYLYHPDLELELYKLVGVLSVEPAPQNYSSESRCAYLYPTVASSPKSVLWGDSWKHVGSDGQPLAISLELPYPQVRFDEENQALWNGDIGPMVNGDRVIVDPVALPDFNDNGFGRYKHHLDTLGGFCSKANASATVLDIKPVAHYCTNNPPIRHRPQCDYALNPDTQTQNQLTLPES